MSTRWRNLTVASLLGIAACAATTTFNSTWKAPDAQTVSPVGKTVAAVFVSHDESKRRPAEDALAADLTARGAHGVAAYTILPEAARETGETARDKLKAAGCNAAVVMRIIGSDQRINYSPGFAMPAQYRGFGPFWGYGWGTVYQPGTFTTDTLVSVETLVYSLDRDKLLWASNSRTTNPRNLNSLVNEVAAATAKEMVRQGLLAP